MKDFAKLLFSRSTLGWLYLFGFEATCMILFVIDGEHEWLNTLSWGAAAVPVIIAAGKYFGRAKIELPGGIKISAPQKAPSGRRRGKSKQGAS